MPVQICKGVCVCVYIIICYDKIKTNKTRPKYVNLVIFYAQESDEDPKLTPRKKRKAPPPPSRADGANGRPSLPSRVRTRPIWPGC